MIVFQWLEEWFEENKQLLLDKGIIFSFSKLIIETDNPARYVDIDTKTQMARVTLWETGDCNFEAIANETSKILFWESQITKSKEELSSFLNKGFAKL